MKKATQKQVIFFLPSFFNILPAALYMPQSNKLIVTSQLYETSQILIGWHYCKALGFRHWFYWSAVCPHVKTLRLHTKKNPFTMLDRGTSVNHINVNDVKGNDDYYTHCQSKMIEHSIFWHFVVQSRNSTLKLRP